jgi:hypothetical protein
MFNIRSNITDCTFLDTNNLIATMYMYKLSNIWQLWHISKLLSTLSYLYENIFEAIKDGGERYGSWCPVCTMILSG